ncbi:MAG: alpha/beta hydrolase [Bauldia sp.]|nr:alpha/beta hydrolase [Bauldia sp.]
MRRTPRAMAAILLAVLFPPVAGAVYQSVATEYAADEFPPPGRLVTVPGGELHILCTGAGAPTVVLDHGGASNSAEWALVQPRIAEATRVCAYDRAGFGWSRMTEGPRDAGQSAADLAALLAAAGETGPFVLVGHGYGAFVSRLFAAGHPGEIAGLVLVDPERPFDHPLVPVEMNYRWKEADDALALAPLASRVGLMRLVAGDDTDLPGPDAAAYEAMNGATAAWESVAAVAAAMPLTSALVLDLPRPAVPVLVLSAGLPLDDDDRRIWTMINADIVVGSPAGEARVVAGVTGEDLTLRRAGADAVSAAILDMVNATRGNRPPAATEG